MTDPRELELPDVGLLTLVDPETGRRREVSTGRAAGCASGTPAAAARSRQPSAQPRCAGPAPPTCHCGRTGDWVADIVRHVHAQRRLGRAARRPAPRP